MERIRELDVYNFARKIIRLGNGRNPNRIWASSKGYPNIERFKWNPVVRIPIWMSPQNSIIRN